MKRRLGQYDVNHNGRKFIAIMVGNNGRDDIEVSIKEWNDRLW